MTIATANAHGNAWLPSIAIHPPIFNALLILLALLVAHILITNRIQCGTIWPRPLSSTEWQGQVVVVTGAAGGVGVELVARLVAKGAKVTALDLRPLPAELHDRLRAMGRREGSVLEVQCDVSSLEDVKRAAKASRQRWSRGATAIVNNAGVVTPPSEAGPLYSSSSSPDDTSTWARNIDRTLRVNLLSHLYTLHIFLPDLVESRTQQRCPTHVVTMSSLMAHIGVPGLSDYVASKWGLLGLHETLKREISMASASASSSSSTSSAAHAAPRTQTTLVLPAHISTPLFPHWSVPRALQPFFPTVSAEYAAERIVKAIGSGKSQTLYMPRTTWMVGWMGVLPEWVREVAQWASGADRAVEKMAAKASKER